MAHCSVSIMNGVVALCATVFTMNDNSVVTVEGATVVIKDGAKDGAAVVTEDGAKDGANVLTGDGAKVNDVMRMRRTPAQKAIATF